MRFPHRCRRPVRGQARCLHIQNSGTRSEVVVTRQGVFCTETNKCKMSDVLGKFYNVQNIRARNGKWTVLRSGSHLSPVPAKHSNECQRIYTYTLRVRTTYSVYIFIHIYVRRLCSMFYGIIAPVAVCQNRRSCSSTQIVGIIPGC